MKEENRLFLTVLSEFQRGGVLDDFILIGSWCHYFYKIYFDNPPEIPLVRTLDLDFLIPHRRKIKREVDVPKALKNLGFEPIIQYPSGYVKFEHPDLAIEFLVPELGKGRIKPYEIKKLHINAQGLRFLTILRDHVITVRHRGLDVNLPEPAAYVLHKLIIGKRRKKKEKAERDLSAAREIGEFLLGDRKQRKRLQKIFKGFPKKWQEKVLLSAKGISQELYDLLVSK